MEIFGWFFPEEIMNWCCDDWYNFVYAPQLLFPLRQHFCDNKGGEPRYNIDGNINFMNNGRENVTKLREKTMALAQKHRVLVDKKLQETEYSNMNVFSKVLLDQKNNKKMYNNKVIPVEGFRIQIKNNQIVNIINGSGWVHPNRKKQYCSC